MVTFDDHRRRLGHKYIFLPNWAGVAVAYVPALDDCLARTALSLELRTRTIPEIALDIDTASSQPLNRDIRPSRSQPKCALHQLGNSVSEHGYCAPIWCELFEELAVALLM